MVAMLVRAQVTIPRVSGIPADVTTNVFHFSTVDSHSTVGPLLVSTLTDFYKVGNTGAGANALVAYLSAVTDPTNARIRLYDLSEPSPRVPFVDQVVNLGIKGGTALPSEVALVGSFQGAPQSGSAQNRRRGRIYLGPLSDLARNASGNQGKPDTVAITALNFAMKRLKEYGDGAADWDWIVYSAGARDNSDKTIPYKERPLLAPTFTAVKNGWVDNAFDTQRRRGEAPTSKTVWV